MSLIFISHAAADNPLAALLQNEIKSSFPECEVFVSSDPGALPPRSPWVNSILDALRRASLVLVLASERGLSRNWVWFEAGAAWSERPRFITCCIGAIHKGSLPAPFALYMALNISDSDDLKILFAEIEKEVECEQRSAPNCDTLEQLLREAETRLAGLYAAESDPSYADRCARVDEITATLEPTQREGLKILVRDGSSHDYVALNELKSRGLAQNLGGLFEGLANATPFLQPVGGQVDTRISTDQRFWELKPEYRALLSRYFTGQHRESDRRSLQSRSASTETDAL
jgi:hypothetical protein